MSGFTVDFHNHLLPGADDGVEDAGEARLALEAFAGAGISKIVATVHVDASILERASAWDEWTSRTDVAWASLREVARKAYPRLQLFRGAELKLDAHASDLSDERLSLGDTPFVLVEFPGRMIPVFAARLLHEVRAAGRIPVLAHPERYISRQDLLTEAREWRGVGAYLQVNHGSIVGAYGSRVQSAARELLENGLVDYLSSDFHGRGSPWVEESADFLESLEGGAEVLSTLDGNAQRLLRGKEPRPVAPLRVRRGALARLRNWFGAA